MASKILQPLEKTASWLNRIMTWLCVVILGVMLLLGTGDVLGRYFLNKPIKGTYETFGFLLPALVLLGLAYAQSERAHVRIDLVFTHLPKRMQTALDIFTCIISLVITCLIFWDGLQLSFHSREIGKLIDTIHLPIWIPQLVIPIGTLAMAFVLIIQIVEDFKVLRNKS